DGEGGGLVPATLEPGAGFTDAERHAALASLAGEKPGGGGERAADGRGGLWTGASPHGLGGRTGGFASASPELHPLLRTAERDDQPPVRRRPAAAPAGLRSHLALHGSGQVA